MTEAIIVTGTSNRVPPQSPLAGRPVTEAIVVTGRSNGGRDDSVIATTCSFDFNSIGLAEEGDESFLQAARCPGEDYD